MKKLYIYWMIVIVVLSGLYGFYPTVAQETQPNPGAAISWKPDGTQMAIFADNGIFIYDRNFQQELYRNIPSASGIWSPDGNKLIVDNQILRSDTLEVLTDFASTPRGWLNGGSQVFALSDGKIHVFDASDGHLVKVIPLDIQLEYAISSPDGTRILSSVANGLYIIDVNRGELTNQYILPVDMILNYGWSPDSSQIALSTDSVVSVGTPGSVTVPDGDSAVLYVFSIMDANMGEILLTSDPLAEDISIFTWSKNTPQIAGLSRSGSVYLWDADTLSLLTAFSVRGQVTGRIAFSPYGGVLVVGVTQKVNNPSPTSQQPLISAEASFALADNTIQLIVPEPSLERLEAIQSACTPPSGGAISLEVPQTEANLDSYIAQVEAAPSKQLPPGCAADLLAVAEAMQSQ